MVSKSILVLTCHGLVVTAAMLLVWSASVCARAGTYDTATPYTPPYSRLKNIPLHSTYNRYEHEDLSPDDPEESEPPNHHGSGSGMAPSELILTGLRTILDVVRNINKRRAGTKAIGGGGHINSTALKLGGAERDSTGAGAGAGAGPVGVRGRGRGMDEYDEHHYPTTTTAKPAKARYTDPWAGYYDWIINEGSFKFWSVFQLFTAALLLYACLSAIYYAKFNPILPDYSMEYDDYFLQRTVGRSARSVDPSDLPSGLSWMSSPAFQFILDAISKHYTEE